MNWTGALVLRFRCPNCSAKLTSREDRAGKTAACPKCQGTITVPQAPTPGLAARQEDSAGPKVHARDPAYNAALLDIPQKGEVSSEAAGERHDYDRTVEGTPEPARGLAAEETEDAGGPGLPWFIDVWLYPLNSAGIVRLISLWLLVCLLCPLVMSLGLGIEYIPFVYTLPVAYVVYFLAECLRDSAGGNRRVPDFWMRPGDFSMWECLSQLFLVVGCIAVCFAPASVYYIVQERADWIYWLLLAGGGFIFPMTLLAVVLFDSPNALNPLLTVGSIFDTLGPYCALVLFFFGGAWLFVRIDFRLYNFRPLPWIPFFLRVVQLYLIFVAVGLLGRFYQRYKEKLKWEV